MIKKQNCVMWIHIKADDVYKDIKGNVETRPDTSNYELERPLPKGKNIKVIGLMKDELGGKIMTKFVGLRAKTYSYLIDDGNEDKEAKCTKKCVIKRKLKFEHYKKCLEETQLENKINYLEKNKIDIDSVKEFVKDNKPILKIRQRFKSERHNVFTKKINKVSLSSSDVKRIQSIDSIQTYACGTSKDLGSDKEEIKCSNMIKRHKK